MSEFVSFLRFFNSLKPYALFCLLMLLVFSALAEGFGVGFCFTLLQGTGGEGHLQVVLKRIFDVLPIAYSSYTLSYAIAGLLLLRGCLLILKDVYVVQVTTALLGQMRQMLMEKIFKAQYRYVAEKEIGFFTNAVTNEFTKISIAFKTFADVLLAMVFAMIYAIPLLFLNPYLLIGFIAGCLPLITLVKKVNAKTRALSIENTATSTQLQSIIVASVRYVKYLKSTETHGSVLAIFSQINKRLKVLLFEMGVLQAISAHAFKPIIALGLLGVFVYQTHVLGNAVTDVLFVLFFLLRSLERALNVQQSYRKFLTSIGSISLYKKLAHDLEENEEVVSESLEPQTTLMPITFNDVSFAYTESQKVLSGVSCCICPRTHVGIVGESGSGKTTLLGLLTGLLQPTQGTVSLGALSYSSLSLKKLRQHVGYVPQEGVMFNDSLKNNVTLWDVSYSHERFMRAISDAGVSSFVDDLSDGFETWLGDDGNILSGGQRQKVAIARELYKECEILVFDEATNAVDTGAEQEIFELFQELKKDRTIISVSHRIASLRNCDVIFVIRDGKIVENGRYEELLKKKGFFTMLLSKEGYSDE